MAKKRISWFGSSTKKKLTRAEQQSRKQALQTTAVLFAFMFLFVGLGVGFVFLDRYVKSSAGEDIRIAKIELVGVPDWVSDELQKKIFAAAGKDLVIDENVAKMVAQNINSCPWLLNVRVRTAYDAVEVYSGYRRPIAMIESQNGKFLLDEQMILLEYVDLPRLPIVRIEGISAAPDARQIGFSWAKNDIAAAVELIKIFAGMDEKVCPNSPLLRELAAIDVGNFDGRKDKKRPHIVIYARDGTEIYWGAEIGMYQWNLEATDKEKLTLLYNTFKELGTLQLRAAGKGRYIDLTPPVRTLELPGV